MEKRSERYDAEETTKKVESSRVNKNKNLYDEINNKIGFEEIPTYVAEKEINLSSLDMDNLNREDYQRVKAYKDLLTDSEKENDKPKEEKPKKNYDINKVLEEAKKNRKRDELEGKRNLKDEDYNVLNTLNKKYINQKGFSEEDNEELKEIIDTITSKTLVDDVKDDEEKELLSELLATTIDIKLENELAKTQLDSVIEETSGTEELIDTNSFYSKSLELSKEDLVEEENNDESAVEEDDMGINEGHNVAKIIFILLLLLIVVAIVVYFVLQSMGITFN